jgi:hypothetical protein
MGTYRWHIGGMSQHAVKCVKDCMPVAVWQVAQGALWISQGALY